MTFKILCTDGFAQAGLDEFKGSPDLDATFEKSLSHEELLAKIEPYHGLIVRSASKVGRDVIEAGKNLKIVARAGVGTDNIDIPAATGRGIFVVNTPAGNTTSTAELAFSLILSLARHIPQAAATTAAGQWEKKKFMGTELAGKTLGVIGMGRIGREVARRARAFAMNVMGYDPFVSEEQFAALGARSSTVEEICRGADFITVHTPLTKDTENLIGAREFAVMKKTVRIVNCARGGIINEEDLAAALKEGRIAGAALDVFTKEPLAKPIFYGLENVILTPHLGASTKEAQDAVAVEAARAVIQFFNEGVSFGAVNLPAQARAEELKGHVRLARKLGSLAAQLCGGKVARLELAGPRAMPRIVTQSAICGVLTRSDEDVSLVNAAAKAAEAGLAIAESIVGGSGSPDEFGVIVKGDERHEAWGAVLSDGTIKVVMCDGYRVDISPDGPLLFIHNSDRPGVIGKVSSILGEAEVNIAGMQNVRRRKGTDALTIIRIDEAAPAEAIEKIRKVDGVTGASLVRL